LNKLLIGNTPLTKSDYLSRKYGCQIFIKEEYYNPGESSKYRVAWYMIQDAIKKGYIHPGGTFVEASSGNTGISLALLAKEKGFKTVIFVTESCSQEKLDILEEYGAKIQLCSNGNGLHDFNSTQYLAQSYAANHPNCYFTNQYYNSANIKAHYQTTGPEIWTQSLGRITHFIAGVGTGGSISGVGRYMKEKNPQVQIWGIEPTGSIYDLFLKYKSIPESEIKFDAIEGIGRTFIPGSFDRNAVDAIFQISQSECKQMAWEYQDVANELLGYSSAAVLAAMDKYVHKMKFSSQDLVVLYFPDYGDRYMHKLYNVKEITEIRAIN